MAQTPGAAPSARPAVAWSWPHALIGVAYALPAAIVAWNDPERGLPLAVGVLPAVLIGIPKRRRSRIVILMVGALAGVSIFAGGLIVRLPTVATAAALVLVVVAGAVLAAIVPTGRVVLVLCVPLVAVGLSFDDLGTSLAAMLLMIAGSAYAWLVSLLWPARAAGRRPAAVLPERRAMTGYGARLGTAAALAYLITSGSGLDHPGWAPAACLLVARPQVDLLQSRGIGRLASVSIGAAAGVLLLSVEPADSIYAVLAVVVLGCASATAASRWYITAGFTTFFVILMVAAGDEGEAVAKTNERIAETVLGVALAYVFGWALPAWTAHRR